MGAKCGHCGTDNGITMYFGKQCKKCGKILELNSKLIDDYKKVDK